MPLQFIKSQKGLDQLFLDGYVYRKRYEKNGRVYWCCVANDDNCGARCVTSDGAVQSKFGAHNHTANPANVEKRKKIEAIKVLAKVTHDPPVKIIAEAVTNMPIAVAGIFPTTSELTRTINRTRRGHRNAPANPHSLVDLVIPASYAKLDENDDFLLADLGAGDERILLFSTVDDLGVLGECEHWFADGTFKASPLLFAQIFTVHGFKQGTTLPLVYGLLPNKEEQTYERFLTALLNVSNANQIQLRPKTILTDFEVGSIDAFDQVFPLSEKRGCYFHFTQCIWRKLQKIPAILSEYNNDADFSLHVRQLGALAFVPIPAVMSSFEILMMTPFFQENSVLLRPLLIYFENTWVGRGRRQPPRFPHSLWNCYQATVDGISRTNNSVEGWHKRFSTLLGADHPSIWKLIDTIKEERSVTQLKKNQLTAGTPQQASRKKYRDAEKRLLKIVEEYAQQGVSEYLLGIAHNIKFQV